MEPLLTWFSQDNFSGCVGFENSSYIVSVSYTLTVLRGIAEQDCIFNMFCLITTRHFKFCLTTTGCTDLYLFPVLITEFLHAVPWTSSEVSSLGSTQILRTGLHRLRPVPARGEKASLLIMWQLFLWILRIKYKYINELLLGTSGLFVTKLHLRHTAADLPKVEKGWRLILFRVSQL